METSAIFLRTARLLPLASGSSGGHGWVKLAGIVNESEDGGIGCAHPISIKTGSSVIKPISDTANRTIHTGSGGLSFALEGFILFRDCINVRFLRIKLDLEILLAAQYGGIVTVRFDLDPGGKAEEQRHDKHAGIEHQRVHSFNTFFNLPAIGTTPISPPIGSS